MKNITILDNQLKKKLTTKQYNVLRKKGTELPFTGELLYNKEKGVYTCGACSNILFLSDAKFDSGTDWPSFFKPAKKESIAENEDRGLFMVRTEIICKKCGSHLGHVFNDGPNPTGLRYCINSCALNFKKKKKR